ncbi:very short patch repair endonuclease [Brevundimonas lutea]|uniref:very short patch repair endonuclease n=1 Tax=Brevundimonas lutea TaxID=2293980 RepID=UPI000F01904B|nr:very short patch repair endonuclease [Brevundimonas lutea]
MTRRQATRADPLTPEQRRRNMSAIRGADTKPEMLIRRGLHASGLRFRLHDRRLPGTPDLVFRSARAVVFVHGCFWHGHDCDLGVRPRTNTAFWETKINLNRMRDAQAEVDLLAKGWRVATVWECALRGRDRRPEARILHDLAQFIRMDSADRLAIRGNRPFTPHHRD